MVGVLDGIMRDAANMQGPKLLEGSSNEQMDLCVTYSLIKLFDHVVTECRCGVGAAQNCWSSTQIRAYFEITFLAPLQGLPQQIRKLLV